jgi:DNA-binding NtrC family response regulator
MNRRPTILVVDDELGVRESFNMVLKDEYKVLLSSSGGEAFDIFRKNSVDLILLDIRLPDSDGLDLLSQFKDLDPATEIIMVTAVKEIQTAVQAIKAGAYEYVVKPFAVDDVLTLIQRALEKSSLMREVAYLRSELERYHPFEKIVGKERKMAEIFDYVATIADSDGPALIQGESGTGKELVARALHNLGPRKDHPFVVVNCAAIPTTMMESEIFGHNKGAFTGAINTTLGKLEIADNGTVFLDDIDTMDINMQAKLLRAIQEKEFERLGGNKVIKVDVRFVAASNKNIRGLIAEGGFREDLFYRLNVFPIKVPPLRERRGDIPLLLDHFSILYSRRTGRTPKEFTPKAVSALMRHDWPGNVRELENLVERLFTVIKGPVIHTEDIAIPSISNRRIKGMKLKDAVLEFERKYVAEVLESAGGSRKRAAEILGVHRNTLLTKINE